MDPTALLSSDQVIASFPVPPVTIAAKVVLFPTRRLVEAGVTAILLIGGISTLGALVSFRQALATKTNDSDHRGECFIKLLARKAVSGGDNVDTVL